jgi:(R)-2-hydroxyacyl-CoA dehydratese activating ATPase
MLKRINATDPILFAGGVTLNRCMVRFLEQATGKEVLVPEDPQMTVALGAALIACG